ncbi:1-acyl-sn-glycerol-3-phosphate acyltransferase [Idiomarina sp. A28L]|uniref:acyltransferase n=1 Tax=Idiomarina sp. A28L TaxID=1036674 RepID=UPI0002138E26|nr:acyltransferase [Idiomarina sp. A28L]EGN76121.1 1-acyl-sn-glycerol-3-phosphate acyltransferase [Idiomarina sp. A28L]
MLRFLPAPFRILVNFLWGALATTVIGITIILLGIIKFILPIPAIQRFVSRIANAAFRGWAYSVSAMFRISYPVKWYIEGDIPDDRDGWFMILCNHQSWVDIVALMHLSRKNLPMPRFFLKHQLLWVPVIGMGCWVLDMPFMKRYSKEQIAKNPELKGKDIETTREKCEKFRHIPTTVINFCEGTRFTPIKHKQKGSPYKHLLTPKAGGTSFTLQAMGNQFQEILDITLVYPDRQTDKSIVLDLLAGRLQSVYVYIDRIPVTDDLRGDYFNDPEFRDHFQGWLNSRWELKDKRIEEVLNR